MAKYRLIRHVFYHDFNDASPVFPSFTLARPSIYLGISFPAANNALKEPMTSAIMPILVADIYAYPIHSVLTGAIERPNAFLSNLLQSENIDCTSIEIVGEWTFTAEDFLSIGDSGYSGFITLFFLEKIN